MREHGGGAERLEQRKAKRRQEILDVAARLFATQGYDGTTAEAIAAAVHLTKSALYTYVGSKEEIAVLLLESVVNQLIEVSEQIEAEGGSPRHKLWTLIVRHVEVLGNHPASSLLFLHSEHILAPDRYPNLYARRDYYETRIRQWIQDGVDREQFAVENVKLAGFMLLGSINWVIRWYSPRGLLPSQSIGQAYASMLLGGLAHPLASDPEKEHSND